MFTVLTKEGQGLPTVISKNNAYYPDYIMAGYEIVFEGSKTDCENVADEMITAYCD